MVSQRIPKETNQLLLPFPNPAVRYVYFHGIGRTTDPFILLNSFGIQVPVEIIVESAATLLYKIDLQTFPKGIYILKNKTFTRRIQKI